jgi:hypothetical protein
VLASPARAVDFSLQGYADFRLVLPESETSWLDGGLGKLRYGSAQPDPNFRFAEAVAQGTLSLSDAFHVVVVARAEPRQRTGVDALEAYAVWRPRIDDWTLSFKAGAFFPPFSLENTDLGWTSPYTLTPSAINSWIGDELRTIGSEARIDRQTPIGNFTAVASVFCCNEPAGVLIAEHGWTLDDRPSGLFEEPRLPGGDRAGEFENIDGNAGWYAGLLWSLAGWGTASIYNYDNDARPDAALDDYHTWRTRFWSAGWESHFGALSILAQAITGQTAIAFPDPPGPEDSYNTDFRSAYLLASYDLGDWRFSARGETSNTQGPSNLSSENGDALTGAVSWMPHDWLRITGEVVAITSRRDQRISEGIAPRQSGTQVQIGTRLFL